MRKFLLSLGLLLTAFCSFGQNEYSTSVSLVSASDDVLTVRSVGISDKKKDAVDMAIKSAFYTLFYRGIDKYNNNKPLVTKDNMYYFDKFMSSRYMMFVRDYSEGETERLVQQKQYKVQVEVNILIKSLTKDLVFEGLMERPLDDITMADTREEIGLPSITVVPYKTDDETYRAILQTDFDRRMAVSKVQQGFNKLGATTIDFEGKLNAVWRSMDFNSNTADSPEKNLLSNSGADVYVIVDLQKDISATQGSRVSLNLKAYETASGNILSATPQHWTNRFNTTDLDILCVYAVDDILEDFLADLSVNFARAIQKGSSVVLRISKGENSSMSLTTQVGSYSLANILRRWVRENAQDGQYHLQGYVAEEMIFDDIKIPSKDIDGFPMDPAQFGDNLMFYMIETLKIPCDMKVDGKSIYITLK